MSVFGTQGSVKLQDFLVTASPPSWRKKALLSIFNGRNGPGQGCGEWGGGQGLLFPCLIRACLL